MPKVSIIIPVYNAEPFIEECLDSILNQIYPNYEVLLIDDGSLDQSGKICDKYASKDSRFIVFHKSNGGVSSARNLGLKNAKGEYIVFLDSDDMFYPQTLERCVYFLSKHNLDLLQFNFTRDLHTQVLDEPEGCVMNSSDFLATKHNVCIAGSIIRRDVLMRNNIFFNENMKLAEDQLFILHAIRGSESVQKIDDILYYYRTNLESATHTSKPGDMIKSCEILIKEKNKHTELAHQIDNTLIGFIIDAVSREANWTELKKLIECYKKTEIKYCDRTSRAGKMFFYISKINAMLAVYLYKLYLTIKY